jgi:hypothetical protein
MSHNQVISQPAKQAVKLTEKQIEEQKRYAAQYLALIQKELSYGDNVNIENVTRYTESYKKHSELAKSGVVHVTIY